MFAFRILYAVLVVSISSTIVQAGNEPPLRSPQLVQIEQRARLNALSRSIRETAAKEVIPVIEAFGIQYARVQSQQITLDEFFVEINRQLSEAIMKVRGEIYLDQNKSPQSTQDHELLRSQQGLNTLMDVAVQSVLVTLADTSVLATFYAQPSQQAQQLGPQIEAVLRSGPSGEKLVQRVSTSANPLATAEVAALLGNMTAIVGAERIANENTARTASPPMWYIKLSRIAGGVGGNSVGVTAGVATDSAINLARYSLWSAKVMARISLALGIQTVRRTLKSVMPVSGLAFGIGMPLTLLMIRTNPDMLSNAAEIETYLRILPYIDTKAMADLMIRGSTWIENASFPILYAISAAGTIVGMTTAIVSAANFEDVAMLNFRGRYTFWQNMINRLWKLPPMPQRSNLGQQIRSKITQSAQYGLWGGFLTFYTKVKNTRLFRAGEDPGVIDAKTIELQQRFSARMGMAAPEMRAHVEQVVRTACRTMLGG